jgi:hypothetical protein
MIDIECFHICRCKIRSTILQVRVYLYGSEKHSTFQNRYSSISLYCITNRSTHIDRNCLFLGILPPLLAGVYEVLSLS